MWHRDTFFKARVWHFAPYLNRWLRSVKVTVNGGGDRTRQRSHLNHECCIYVVGVLSLRAMGFRLPFCLIPGCDWPVTFPQCEESINLYNQPGAATQLLILRCEPLVYYPTCSLQCNIVWMYWSNILITITTLAVIWNYCSLLLISGCSSCK